MHEAFPIDPMAEAAGKVPLTRNSGPLQLARRKEERLGRNNVVLAAMDQKIGGKAPAG